MNLHKRRQPSPTEVSTLPFNNRISCTVLLECDTTSNSKSIRISCFSSSSPTRPTLKGAFSALAFHSHAHLSVVPRLQARLRIRTEPHYYRPSSSRSPPCLFTITSDNPLTSPDISPAATRIPHRPSPRPQVSRLQVMDQRTLPHTSQLAPPRIGTPMASGT